MKHENKRRRPPRLPSDAPIDFDLMSRRALFRDKQGEIPGHGTSAAAASVRHVRTKVTMNLDGDVIDHFKSEAKTAGLPYQTLINQVLREYISGNRPERLAKQIGELLADDPSFVELLAERLKNN